MGSLAGGLVTSFGCTQKLVASLPIPEETAGQGGETRIVAAGSRVHQKILDFLNEALEVSVYSSVKWESDLPQRWLEELKWNK